jgi:hypothetical protein
MPCSLQDMHTKRSQQCGGDMTASGVSPSTMQQRAANCGMQQWRLSRSVSGWPHLCTRLTSWMLELESALHAATRSEQGCHSSLCLVGRAAGG